MYPEVKSFRDAALLVLRTWRRALPFFASIELWLMVLAAVSTVGAVWLLVMGDARALLAFGFAVGYPVLRTVLHTKRILHWPFI